MHQRFLHILLCTTACCLIAGGSSAQEKPPKRLSYETQTDIPYRDGGDLSEAMRERCRLDVYRPTDATGVATLVWFHGGGLTGGSKSIPTELKEKGIVVVAPNYRLSPDVRSPAHIEDAAAAVAWTFANIERLGGSRQSIFVGGHSAGGYLSCMIGLDPRWLKAHDIDCDDIAGLVPASGQMITHFTIRAERGLERTTPVIDELAPLYHVHKDAPPMLLTTGDRDMEIVGRYEENAYFCRMMREVGHPSTELYELEGYDHGQMAGPAYPLILRFIDETRP